MTFLTGVKDSSFSIWNVSLVLSRAFLYVLWFLLVTGLVQALRHEPENQTGLARVIDALVGSAPSQTGQNFHEMPEAIRERRSISFDLHQFDAAGLISHLAAPTPAPGSTSTPGSTPAPSTPTPGSTSTPGSTPAPSAPTPGSTSTPGSTPAADEGLSTPTSDEDLSSPVPYRIFPMVTLAAGVIGGLVALLLVAAGLYGVALWIQCTHAVRNSGNQVRRCAFQSGECGELEEV